MTRGAEELVRAAGGLRPSEAGVPDRGIVGTRLLTSVQPDCGLLVAPAPCGQVGQPEPHAIVVGSRLFGLGQRLSHSVDRIGIVVGGPESAQDRGGIVELRDLLVQEVLVLVALARHPREPFE